MAQVPPLVVCVPMIAAASQLVPGGYPRARPAGTTRRRAIGWTWATRRLTAAISSPRIPHVTGIPLFTLLTLVVLPVALWNAHRGDVAGPRKRMKRFSLVGMVVAGAFTPIRGRLLGNAWWKGAWGDLPPG